jgi:5-formyltetrahydrofolate cyclo-ligase
LQLAAYIDAKRISVFLSMPSGEVSTRDIVVDALESGKRVFVPYIKRFQDEDGKAGASMEMLALYSVTELELLKSDNWGIPTLDERSISSRENAFGGVGIIRSEGDSVDSEGYSTPGLDLILVPGVAFDANNGRLGHGKGFYDRYLTRYQSAARSQNASGKMPLLGGWTQVPCVVHALIFSPVGLALHQQLLPSGQTVPTGVNDWRVDRVVSVDP